MDPKALYAITYGLYIVTSGTDETLGGQTANAVFQVSNDPPTIAVSINKGNQTHHLIDQSNRFLVSVLSQEAPLRLIGHFGFKSGRDVAKLESVPHKITGDGLPYLTDHTLAYVQARVVGRADAGTHTMFIGKVTDARVLSPGTPMTYAFYHEVKRGTSPGTAPVGKKPGASRDGEECQ